MSELVIGSVETGGARGAACSSIILIILIMYCMNV